MNEPTEVPGDGYEFLDDIAIADVAFRARGRHPAAVFEQAARATLEVMVDDLHSIRRESTRPLDLEDEDLEMLLFDFLQELIYYKDAEELLLLPEDLEIGRQNAAWRLTGTLAGEKIDRRRHAQNADVKAVTLHRFALREGPEGWTAQVVLDI